MSWIPAQAWDDKAEALLESQRVDSEKTRAKPCDHCGQIGRVKAISYRGGVEHVWCHDDDNSCYGYKSVTVPISGIYSLGFELDGTPILRFVSSGGR